MPLLLLLRPLLGSLAPLLGLLAPLLKRRDTYYLAAIGTLGFLLWSSNRRLHLAETALALKPRVETVVQTKIKTVVVQGPERVVEKLVAGAVVERTVYRDPVTTTTGAENNYATKETPICTAPGGTEALPGREAEVLAPGSRWRYAGIMVDPFSASKLVGLRGGVTVWGRLDLGLGVRFVPHPQGQAEISLRF